MTIHIGHNIMCCYINTLFDDKARIISIYIIINIYFFSVIINFFSEKSGYYSDF